MLYDNTRLITVPCVLSTALYCYARRRAVDEHYLILGTGVHNCLLVWATVSLTAAVLSSDDGTAANASGAGLRTQFYIILKTLLPNSY